MCYLLMRNITYVRCLFVMDVFYIVMLLVQNQSLFRSSLHRYSIRCHHIVTCRFISYAQAQDDIRVFGKTWWKLSEGCRLPSLSTWSDLENLVGTAASQARDVLLSSALSQWRRS